MGVQIEGRSMCNTCTPRRTSCKEDALHMYMHPHTVMTVPGLWQQWCTSPQESALRTGATP